jgi:hypothetical protein
MKTGFPVAVLVEQSKAVLMQTEPEPGTPLTPAEAQLAELLLWSSTWAILLSKVQVAWWLWRTRG